MPFETVHPLWLPFRMGSAYNLSWANVLNKVDHEVAANRFRCHELPPSIDCIESHRILSFSPFYVQQLKIVYLLPLANYIPSKIGRSSK